MSYIRILFLFLILSSCQEAPVSKLQEYKLSKQAKLAELTDNFKHECKALTLQTEQNSAFYVQQEADRVKSIKLLDSLYQLDIAHASADQFSKEPTLPHTQTNVALHQKVRDFDAANNKIHALINDKSIRINKVAQSNSEYHKGSMMEIMIPGTDIESTLELLKSCAIEINHEIKWHSDNANKITTTHHHIEQQLAAFHNFHAALQNASNAEERIAYENALVEQKEALTSDANLLQKGLSDQHYSSLLFSFYEDIQYTAPPPTSFKADMTANLHIGWDNFKQFLLNSALIWPYIILAVIFLTTALLAVSSSRKKARDFKLQMLQNQTNNHQYSELNSTKK